MKLLEEYLYDGADNQSRIVLTMLQEKSCDNNIKVGRWDNGREQGYAITVNCRNGNYLHICWFEHRNSDNICAIKWIDNKIKANINNIPDGIYKNKYDVSYMVGYGEWKKITNWIYKNILQYLNFN